MYRENIKRFQCLTFQTGIQMLLKEKLGHLFHLV